ncbi:MAG: NAD(P)H-hydrate epimerase, partial [Clostridia bacterium]|nr:NAD(P)H-hydrate epimerase [Clostridia bacterium]
MLIVTSKQMYQAECNAVERGMTFPRLMENAGKACADIITKKFCISKENPRKVLVICGKGKNGGDGFVIARKLWETGCDVTVMLACGEPKAKDAADMFTLIESTSADIIRYDNNLTVLKPYLDKAEIIVDAVFGTGFIGALDQSLSVLAKAVNATKAIKIAIDIPSGANCDSATIEGTVFKADMTVAISAYKPIHVIKPCNTCCGRTVIADIGIKPEDFRKLDTVVCKTYDAADVKALLPKRKPVSNKG